MLKQTKNGLKGDTMNFTGNVIQPTSSLLPQQQIVVPPITIPQGFSAKPQPQSIIQLTAKGKEAAKKIPLGPNSKVAIFDEDSDQDIFYYREVDEYGNDIEFSIYSYTKIEDPPPPEFLTKQEFRSELNEAFASFAAQLKEDLLNGKSVREKD